MYERSLEKFDEVLGLYIDLHTPAGTFKIKILGEDHTPALKAIDTMIASANESDKAEMESEFEHCCNEWSGCAETPSPCTCNRVGCRRSDRT